MAGKKISAQPLVGLVNGNIKMPTGEVGDTTISVDQIAEYSKSNVLYSQLQSAKIENDLLDFQALSVIVSPDYFEQIPAATLSAANLNWAGAVRVLNPGTGGYLRYIPVIDGILNSTYTVDLTKGSLTFATVTYIPNTFPPPVNAVGGDRAYVTCGIYRDQIQDSGQFAVNRSIASIFWNKNSSEFLLFANDGALIIPTGVIASQNTEYHTQITITGTNCKVWINGLLVIDTTIILPVNTSVVAAIGLSTQLFGSQNNSGNDSGTEIWVDWYGLKYTPNSPRKVGYIEP